ncbi:ATP-binding cassette protein, putative [Perkinsus marinus ATCC 50983]|uniref:ATP-binding cassette protein, putative n=1 Tax=Perkinsus marinus (strain ATCC 50983 / TXsc) TaxID=423536 RepID=C5LYY4_PERM5|nr:ATP-binding cassette protein, putative [Perkinsus marinus ATCC 50983]EEQ97993.1 ATP-binding cassette protein, putative [Perkinsus marinus ATCC 50983]|eukprot:XP_002765276.1 ATP-binding cassette protein, putative [Perkinsus marinus ATCC 50983]
MVRSSKRDTARTHKKKKSEEGKTSSTSATSAAAAAPKIQDAQLAEIAKFGLPSGLASLSDADDFTARWLECLAEGRQWGGASYGGRGVQVHNSGDVIIDNVTLCYVGNTGSTSLLENAKVQFLKGHCYGLIGVNGAGKTTLLRRLASFTLPGTPLHLKYAYVAQELTPPPEEEALTTLDYTVAADVERALLMKEDADLNEKLIAGVDMTDEEVQRVTEVVEQLDAIGADQAAQRARAVLMGLGFPENLIDAPVKHLSGGWLLRVELARAISMRPDVLLLDEPTNHLDLHAKWWLTEWLSEKREELVTVIVSHDSEFMDEVCTDICRVDSFNKKLVYYTGNFTSFKEQLNARTTRLTGALEAQQKQKDRAAAFIQNNKHSDDPNKQKQAAERLKKMDRLNFYREDGKKFKKFSLKVLSEDAVRLPEYIDAKVSNMSASNKVENFKFKFLQPAEIDKDLYIMKKCVIGYGKESIVGDVTFTVQMGARIVLVGPNGTGKSTLMSVLNDDGVATKISGGRRVENRCRVALVSQHHLQKMKDFLDISPVEYFKHERPEEANLSNQEICNFLGSFGLGRFALSSVIGQLSGGQRARLDLAVAVASRPHLLLLDEPTNHLDVVSQEALAKALETFDGAVVAVTHSEEFMGALRPTQLWSIEKGRFSATPVRDEEEFNEVFGDYKRRAVKEARKLIKASKLNGVL